MGGASALRAVNHLNHLNHAGQPAGPVEPGWLHTAGQIAGVALMIELLIALLIVAALMFGLAYGMWWLSRNVVPVIGDYSEQAQQYIAIAERGSDRVAHGVATFHGARAGIAAGLRAFFLPGHRPRPEAPAANAYSAPAPAPAHPQTGRPAASRAQPASGGREPAARQATFRVAGQASGRVAGRVAAS